jgi:hypothetical protein
MLVVSFLTPPILTIWGIGIAVLSYKRGLVCAIPTSTIVASYLVSVAFSYPLGTFFSVGTMMIMVYTLVKNIKRRDHIGN